MPIPQSPLSTGIEQLIQEAVVTVPRRLIAEAIDLVVFIGGRGTFAPRREPSRTCPGVSADGEYELTQSIGPKLHAV